MRVTIDGKVGIGTNAPSELLTVGESTSDQNPWGSTSMSILGPGENSQQEYCI